MQDVERTSSLELPTATLHALQSGVAVTRATGAYLRGDIERAYNCAERALALLSHETPHEEANLLARLAYPPALLLASVVYKINGDVSKTIERQAYDAIARLRTTGNLATTVLAYNNVARIHIYQGHLETAQRTYEALATVLPELNLLSVLTGGPSYYLELGNIFYERNELALAEQHIARGVELVTASLGAEADVTLAGFVVWTRLLGRRGMWQEALQALTQWEHIAQQHGYDSLLIERANAERARLHVLRGRSEEAVRWANASGITADTAADFTNETALLCLARIYTAQGRALEILPLLDAAIHAARVGRRYGSVLALSIARALALDAQEKTAAALASLEQALALGEPQGYVRSFVDEGPTMERLLREALRQGIHSTYCQSLLAMFPDSHL